jgi:hypothetical protein
MMKKCSLFFWLSIIPVLTACSSSVRAPEEVGFCGGSSGNSKVAGLSWLAGSPSQANVLCSIASQGNARVAFSLDPESRDPLLFRDNKSAVDLLVERFSGRQSRPSRITWFSFEGEKRGQRGDWPRNVYGVNLLSPAEAVVTGFDEGEIQLVNWQSESFASPGATVASLSQEVVAHPVQTLANNGWFAVIDNGYDLVRYAAKESKVFIFDKNKQRQPPVSEMGVTDPATGGTCLNAFQSLSISSSEILLSCNPQYFGPAAGNRVALFRVELKPDGQVQSRELVHFDGAEIQRIDLWGLDSASEQAFVGYKKTGMNDYEGVVANSGWIDLRSGKLKSESRFAGPMHNLSNGNGSVVFCLSESQSCSRGQFIFIEGQESQSENSIVTRLDLRPVLPFLSFAQELKSP